METTFASVVDSVRDLPLEAKTELKDILDSYIIEERREEILKNGEEGRIEYEKGKLTFSSNVDELMASLNDD